MSAAVLPLITTSRRRLPEPALDDRYRRLLGDAGWRLLPNTVQQRFSRHLADGEQIVYRGEVVAMELSGAGWLIAQIARLAGGPLPFTRHALGPCVVVVTEDARLGGQVWSRSYPRATPASKRGRFPQVIHSAKRFSGPTGLEEYLGCGLVMQLTLHEAAGQLVFRSAGYALEIAGRRMHLPRWLTPGRCTVTHRAETDGRFSFTLTLDHPLLGRLAHQVAFFRDDGAA